MSRIIFLFFFLYLSLPVFSQTAKPFEEFKFDSSYSVVGIGSNWSSHEESKRFDFILTKLEDLNQLKAAWKFKVKKKPILLNNNYNIYVLKNNEIVESFIINLSNRTISIGQKWYDFDSSLLEALNKKSPLYYHTETKDFLKTTQSQGYCDSLKTRPGFLLMFGPRKFSASGTFYVTYHQSKLIPDFKVATSVLSKEVLKLTSPDKYFVGYELSDYNLDNPKKFQVTVEADRSVYDKLQGDFEKGDWREVKYTVTSLWKDSINTPRPSLALSDTIIKIRNLGTLPVYPGGTEKFIEYLGKNFRYPKAAIENGITGKMVASFVIEKDGSVTDIKFINDLGYGTAEELKRLLKNCERWKPGMLYNVEVRTEFIIPFKIMTDERSPRSVFQNSPHVATYSTLPDPPQSSTAKLPPLSISKQRFVFPEHFKTCVTDTLYFEDKKTAISDRYSVLQEVINALPQDSLKNLTGRISLQVLIDTTGSPCVMSLKNELNSPLNSKYVADAIVKTKWTLLALSESKPAPISIVLVFTFEEQRVKYQHLAMKSDSPVLNELEITTKGKFSRY